MRVYFPPAGQIQKEAAIPSLRTRLADQREHYMVRHECAEALGSIGSLRLLLRFILTSSFSKVLLCFDRD